MFANQTKGTTNVFVLGSWGATNTAQLHAKQTVEDAVSCADSHTEILAVLADLDDQPNWQLVFQAVGLADKYALKGMKPKAALRKAVVKVVKKNFDDKAWDTRSEGRLIAMSEKLKARAEQFGLKFTQANLFAAITLIGDSTSERDVTLAHVLTDPTRSSYEALVKVYPTISIELTGDFEQDFDKLKSIFKLDFDIDHLRAAVNGDEIEIKTTEVQATAPAPESSAVPTVVQAAAPVEAQVAPVHPETRPAPVPLDIPATEVVEESQEALAVSAVGVASTRLHADPTVGVVNGNLLTELGEQLFREHRAAGKAVSVEAFASELIGRYRQHMAAEVEKLLTSNKRQRRG